MSWLKSLSSKSESPSHISSPINTTPATKMGAPEEENKSVVVCVFCGSISGKNPAHLKAARDLAAAFHKENITLVYGGGTGGLMGELARELVKLSGPKAVHGVIPRALVKIEDGYRSTHTKGGNGGAGKAPEREILTSKSGVSDQEVSELLQESEYGITTIVADMHTRKQTMANKVIAGAPGSGFVSLAGGFGTIEEVMEMVTWNQLGIHHRGIVLLNIDGYWDGLLAWVKNSAEEGFVSEANQGILVECKEVGEALEALRQYQVSKDRFRLDWGK